MYFSFDSFLVSYKLGSPPPFALLLSHCCILVSLQSAGDSLRGLVPGSAPVEAHRGQQQLAQRQLAGMMWAACVLLTAHALVPPPRRVARGPARRAQSAAADAAEKTWRSRRRLARAAFDARGAWDRAAAQAELEREDEEDLDVVQSTVSTTAFGVVLVALVVRFGGRATGGGRASSFSVPRRWRGQATLLELRRHEEASF